jgi:hypothetical protein
MPEQRARLRVHGHGGIEVDLATAYLRDLHHAYDSIIVFEATIDGLRRMYREFPFRISPFGQGLGWPLASRRAIRFIHDWPPSPAEISSLVPSSEHLVLSAVNLGSPGFWEFLGSLNAFETLRKWLNDRHERRKDREYRESAEQRRLAAENLQCESAAIRERIQIARELGFTDRDLAPLLNELVLKPLAALGNHQDKGTIEHAEILRLPDDRKT